MLETRALTVALRGKEILHSIDCAASPGAITAIVGPNGSGKTTMLRAITGDIPYGGEVLLDRHRIDEAQPLWLAERRAVLPQSTRLAFPFTVHEVVRLGFLASATPDPSLVSGALDRVGLSGFEARFYHELSGGEQQRAQLARVLIQVWQPVVDGHARWLFLDEPVASLDIGHQLQVMDVARDFAERGGGVIAVMHDLNLTAMFASSVVLLSQGRLDGQGAPADMLRDDLLSEAYGCAIRVSAAPAGVPFILPQVAAR